MSAEVFISYAAKDRTRVLDLVDRLRTAGVSVWIDQMGIEGATMWSQEIVAAIRSCKVLILAISENSAGSENVVKEVALASEGRILPGPRKTYALDEFATALDDLLERRARGRVLLVPNGAVG